MRFEGDINLLPPSSTVEGHTIPLSFAAAGGGTQRTPELSALVTPDALGGRALSGSRFVVTFRSFRLSGSYLTCCRTYAPKQHITILSCQLSSNLCILPIFKKIIDKIKKVWYNKVTENKRKEIA